MVNTRSRNIVLYTLVFLHLPSSSLVVKYDFWEICLSFYMLCNLVVHQIDVDYHVIISALVLLNLLRIIALRS